jgi:hypothetical protein
VLTVFDRLFETGGRDLLRADLGGRPFEERVDRWAEEQVAALLRESMSDPADSGDIPSAP